MNQILVTKKLYITPELKRKKKVYKFEFIISIFLVCVLTSLCIYAEYDRTKNEKTSSEILSNFNQLLAETAQSETTKSSDDDVLVVILNNMGDYATEAATEETTTQELENLANQAEKRTSKSGYKYSTIASISIPKINVNYPILQGETGSDAETEELLKLSPCKFHGPQPNEVGNFCIVGHNYRDNRFFSKVKNLVVGDTIQITDLSKRTITYQVYDKHTVDPDDTKDTTQWTGGKKEVTLITCTDDSSLRIIVKCKEVK